MATMADSLPSVTPGEQAFHELRGRYPNTMAASQGRRRVLTLERQYC